MHRARAARPRGFDSLPSLSDVAPRFIYQNHAEVSKAWSKVDYTWKSKSCNNREFFAAKNTVDVSIPLP
jgi:hypothetical protein